MKEYPLTAVRGVNGTTVAVGDHGLHFCAAADSGCEILQFGDFLAWCDHEDIDLPAIIVVEVSLSTGTIEAANSAHLMPSDSQQQSSQASSGSLCLLVEDSSRAASLAIRTLQAPIAGTLSSISVVSRRVDPATYKRLRARMFPHWYYTCCLGDGIVQRATVSDEQSTMAGLLANRDKMLAMLENYFGTLGGATVLDVGCSAGLHSFELARRGAIVTAIDWDANAILQAQFVQECIADQLPGRVDFKCVDLFAFDAPAGGFDVVYCSGVFYHLQDPIGAARRLATMTRSLLLIQSSITPRAGDLLELSNPAQFPFCASWEFALVPTASMLRKIFEHAGCKALALIDSSQLPRNPVAKRRQKLAGPVYLACQPPRPKHEA
jgi:2-polyprenyl-3-methyl-5-hydroxy-6-metoxy-1,4-benzoquinol methylase